jgi:hypothetical protein
MASLEASTQRDVGTSAATATSSQIPIGNRAAGRRPFFAAPAGVKSALLTLRDRYLEKVNFAWCDCKVRVPGAVV